MRSFFVDIINLLKEIKINIHFVRWCAFILYTFFSLPIILLLFTWVLSTSKSQWICVPVHFCAFVCLFVYIVSLMWLLLMLMLLLFLFFSLLSCDEKRLLYSVVLRRDFILLHLWRSLRLNFNHLLLCYIYILFFFLSSFSLSLCLWLLLFVVDAIWSVHFFQCL